MSVRREETTNKPRTKRHHCWSWTCKGVIFLPPAPLVQKHHCKLRLTPACCFALPALNFCCLKVESGNFLVVNESQHNIHTLISIHLPFDALCPLRSCSVMTHQLPSFFLQLPKQTITPKPAAQGSLYARTRWPVSPKAGAVMGRRTVQMARTNRQISVSMATRQETTEYFPLRLFSNP